VPEGEDQPTTDVDLFISTERLKVVNSGTKVTRFVRRIQWLIPSWYHGIMGVVFIKTNIQSKMMNTTTMSPYRRIS